MKSKYFKIDRNTTAESLHKAYKKLVNEHHADSFAGKGLSDDELAQKEIEMSEINIEYTMLRKKFKKDGKSIYNNFRNAQNELAEILSNLPKEVKDESQDKMRAYFNAKWEKALKPMVPESLQGIADLIVKDKIKNFDFETQLSKFNFEEFINQFEPIKDYLTRNKSK